MTRNKTVTTLDDLKKKVREYLKELDRPVSDPLYRKLLKEQLKEMVND